MSGTENTTREFSNLRINLPILLSSHGMTSPSTSCSSVSCTSRPHGKMNMTTGSSANMSSSADVVGIPPTKQQATDSAGANSTSVSSDTGMSSGSTGSNNMSSTSNTNETVTYHQHPPLPQGSIDGQEGEGDGNMEDEGKQSSGRRRDNGTKIDDDAVPLPPTTSAMFNTANNSTTRPIEREVVTLRIKLEEREYAYQDLLTKYQRRKERHREDVRRMRSVDVRVHFLEVFSGSVLFFLSSMSFFPQCPVSFEFEETHKELSFICFSVLTGSTSNRKAKSGNNCFRLQTWERDRHREIWTLFWKNWNSWRGEHRCHRQELEGQMMVQISDDILWFVNCSRKKKRCHNRLRLTTGVCNANFIENTITTVIRRLKLGRRTKIQLFFHRRKSGLYDFMWQFVSVLPRFSITSCWIVFVKLRQFYKKNYWTRTYTAHNTWTCTAQNKTMG